SPGTQCALGLFVFVVRKTGDVTMFHSLRQIMQGVRGPFASARQTQRPRPQPRQLVLEKLEDRLVPSTSSAISIQHPGGLTYTSSTEREWYTVNQATHQVVEFQYTTRR